MPFCPYKCLKIFPRISEAISSTQTLRDVGFSLVIDVKSLISGRLAHSAPESIPW